VFLTRSRRTVTTHLSCSSVFAAGVQRKTSAFGVEPRRMLKIIRRFGRHCSCHQLSTFDAAHPRKPKFYNTSKILFDMKDNLNVEDDCLLGCYAATTWKTAISSYSPPWEPQISEFKRHSMLIENLNRRFEIHFLWLMVTKSVNNGGFMQIPDSF
jgi:hypothetical protein